MTEPRDDYVNEGGDGTDATLPEDAPEPEPRVEADEGDA